MYGSASFEDLAELCRSTGRKLGLSVDVRQTDDERELISWVHEAADARLPVVLNPAAFTHYSYALRDALAMRTAPLVEVHMSNPAARESFRHTSVVAAVANGTVAASAWSPTSWRCRRSPSWPPNRPPGSPSRASKSPRSRPTQISRPGRDRPRRVHGC